ncbi:MAG TPA: hypothetical protein VJ965_10075 [Anaerolineales bacterium]|nr:hypothetical protein [Anaerolineales bacterium]
MMNTVLYRIGLAATERWWNHADHTSWRAKIPSRNRMCSPAVWL